MNQQKITKQNSIYDLLDQYHDKDIKKFSFNGVFTISKVVSVYDGDTCKIILPIHALLKHKPNKQENIELTKLTIRMYGYDSPEIRTKNPDEKQAAIKARDFLRDMILEKIVYVEFFNFDKYGRSLANIYLDENKIECVNNVMLNNQHGVAYFGGTKQHYHKQENKEKEKNNDSIMKLDYVI